MLNDSNSVRSHDQTPEYEPLSQLASPPPLAAEPPQQQSKSIFRRWTPLILNTWLCEILAIIFSFACFVAITCVLWVFNEKPPPDFAYGFTLNAIISILATASKSSLIYVIGECIGQLKWIWFYQTEKKQLYDMDLFDSASRGPLGSLFMILEHKSRSLASLGAILTVLALMFDPFVQQVLTYPTRQTIQQTNSSGAIVHQAFNFFPQSSMMDFQRVIYTGVWSISPDQLNPSVTCSSGNCQWEPFDSVGVCSQCEDITAHTELDCDTLVVDGGIPSESTATDCKVIPPQGNGTVITINSTVRSMTSMADNSYHSALFLDVPDQIVWSPFQRNLSKDQDGSNATYVDIKSPQSVIAHAELSLASNLTTQLPPLSDMVPPFRLSKVTQCAITFCARTYQISVSNGTAAFNVSAPDFGQIFSNPDPEPRPIFARHPDCWMPTRGPGPESVNVTDSPGFLGYADISKFAFCPFITCDLRSYLEGHAVMQYVASDVWPWRAATDYRFPSENPAAGKIVSDGLEAVVSNVAMSLTRAAFMASNYTVQGTEYAFEVYTSVDWIWLLLPAALVSLGILFLALTMLTNKRRRLHPWKSSILAVLFHGLSNPETDVGGKQITTAAQMEKTAQGIHVKLSQVDQRKSLVLD
ncbi:hypothetical protein FQN54_003091 [Arachnomyces sp. PD_36]|nr:hypothetical protein FQN54_003091 [Arachnomyces sp. PD_36]